MSKGKKITLIALIVLFISICAVIDVWYLWVLWAGDKQVVSKTFNVGSLTLADGTEENFMEIEYFANADGSGYEAFEVKINYFMDENKESVYTQGLQYVATSTTSSINFALAHDDIYKELTNTTYNIFTGYDFHYNCLNTLQPFITDFYNYAYDGTQYLMATNPIGLNTCFKIELDDKLCLMQFKGGTTFNKDGALSSTYAGTPMNSSTYYATEKDDGWYNDDFHNMYIAYDINFFVKSLYQAIASAEYGTNEDIVFEWGNLFNYYLYDTETGKYIEEPTDYDNIIKTAGDIRSYYSIRVRTHENGLSSSQQSMFGSFLGNQNFNLSGDYSGGEYFVGRTIIDCNINSFDLVTVDSNNVALKLSDAFVDYYTQYKSKIALNVEINLELLESLGYTFIGFTADSRLDNFKIYKCYTISGGEIVDDYTSALKVVSV